MISQNTVILVSGLLTILIGLLVFLKNFKNPSNIWFFLMCFFGGSWGVMKAIQLSVMDLYWHDALISRLIMFFGTLAPLGYFMLAHHFPYKIKVLSQKTLFFVFLIAGILALLNLAGVLRHADVSIIDNTLHRDIVFWNFLIFAIYFFAYVFWGFILLAKKYAAADGVNKYQIRYLMIATVTTFLTTGIVSIIFLLFNNFKYDWLGAVFLLINFFVIAYFVFIKPMIRRGY